MFHACATRFDATENLKNFLVFRVQSLDQSSTWFRWHVEHSGGGSGLRRSFRLRDCVRWNFVVKEILIYVLDLKGERRLV